MIGQGATSFAYCDKSCFAGFCFGQGVVCFKEGFRPFLCVYSVCTAALCITRAVGLSVEGFRADWG